MFMTWYVYVITISQFSYPPNPMTSTILGLVLQALSPSGRTVICAQRTVGLRAHWVVNQQPVSEVVRSPDFIF